MQMKFACADFTFPLLPHDRALDLIALLGIPAVDVGLFEGRSHLQPSHVLGRGAASARELLSKLHDRGLELADVYFQARDFRTLAANHPDAAERARSRDFFLRMLEFAARCNATHLSGLPGIAWEGEPHQASLDRCAAELAWRAAQAAQLGITYAVEAHIGSVVPTPDQAMRLIEMTPGLTLTLDYGHFTYLGIEDASVEPLMPHASHFHARCACKGRLQAPLKENTIDFSRIVRAMAAAGYTGYVGIEYVWVDWERCNEVDNVSETILLRDVLLEAAAACSATAPRPR